MPQDHTTIVKMLSIITDSTKYKIGEFRLDPLDAKIGETVTLTFDPTDACKINYYDTGDPS